MNVMFYLITVLVWGTTWYAIKLQGDYAPAGVSILYRAILAAIILFGWCKLRGISLRFSWKDHVFLCMLGLSMFSLHYIFGYYATQYIASGLISVIFSSTSFLSILYNFIFFRVKPTFQIISGALMGIGGLCLFVGHEVTQVDWHDDTLHGVLLVSMSALIFSLGGSISKRNSNHGLAVIPTITMGMVYATAAMLIYNVAIMQPLVFPVSTVYWGLLLYLVIAGSIVAFVCYLKLIQNIGPELAGYTSILSPMVALLVSWGLEGYTWSLAALLGLLLIMIGNILVMRKRSAHLK
jgi:drug/metabolite transporter (DMT)-like permease